MGALPDREPLTGPPTPRSGADAPPLSVVPNDTRTPATKHPSPPPASAATPTETSKQEAEVGRGVLDLDRIQALRSWAGTHLRPPDLWHEASPGLKHLWEQALRGDHLPDNRVVRVAEIARMVLSLPLIAVSIMLAWSCVSAARQAALALAVASLWLVGSTLLSAVTDLL